MQAQDGDEVVAIHENALLVKFIAPAEANELALTEAQKLRLVVQQSLKHYLCLHCGWVCGDHSLSEL